MKKLGFLFVFVGSFVWAQDHLSGFNMMSLTYKISPKLMLYGEGQIRARKDYTLIDYYETKGGIGYSYIKDHQVFVGAGRYGTYEDRKISQEEFRIWLQYTFSHKMGTLKLDHRGRAEKRFFYASQTGTNTEAMRYRYRLSGTLPLNNSKVQEGTFFVNAFEELFFGAGEPNFKRNRSFAGFGYQFNNSLSATTGYMFQREFSTKKNENYHFLYFALNFTIDPSDDEKDFSIPMVD
ncbi:DUF2490 domain-containing protein [Epilithonimonas hominis]|uniref:DUF2490 domain-containing protein n=1 Tax=Epilithonimonas hominis TaxID=420404 RepID=UPI001FE701FE|nr:DUF2490 domain-containing protein [Epilithonimonas hominis]